MWNHIGVSFSKVFISKQLIASNWTETEFDQIQGKKEKDAV